MDSLLPNIDPLISFRRDTEVPLGLIVIQRFVEKLWYNV
jgi:hypothetical protein